jgi:hypothetical protein
VFRIHPASAARSVFAWKGWQFNQGEFWRFEHLNAQMAPGDSGGAT